MRPDIKNFEKTGEHRRPEKGEFFWCSYCEKLEECKWPDCCGEGDIYRYSDDYMEGIEMIRLGDLLDLIEFYDSGADFMITEDGRLYE